MNLALRTTQEWIDKYEVKDENSDFLQSDFASAVEKELEKIHQRQDSIQGQSLGQNQGHMTRQLNK